MLKTDYNIPIFEDTDAADLNKYSNEMANALKTQINNTNNEIKEIDKKVVDAVDKFTEPLSYKGQVSTIQNLPTGATNGDIYNVTSENKNYIYNGTNWVEYSSTLDLTYLENNTKTTQTTEISEELTINNCAGVKGKLDIKSGKTIQAEGTPSPDNIIPIRNVGDNISLIKIVDGTYTNQGVTTTITNGKIKSTGTATTTYANINTINDMFEIKIFKGETYTFSRTKKDNTKLAITLWNSSNDYQQVEIPSGQKSITFTSNSNYSTGWLFYSGIVAGQAINISDYQIKLEKGSIATPYTPYNCGSADFQLSNEDNSQSKIKSFPFTEGQRLHIGDYLASNGTHHKRKTLVLTGNETITRRGYVDSTNKTYRYSIELEGRDNSSRSNLICSHLPTDTQYNQNKSLIFGGASIEGNIAYLQLVLEEINLTDVTKIDEYLKTQYANGTPVTIEYDLAEEIVIPYTAEQEEAYYQLQHLLMYEGYTQITCIDEIKPDIQGTYYFDNELNNMYISRIDSLEEKIRLLEKLVSSQSGVSE